MYGKIHNYEMNPKQQVSLMWEGFDEEQERKNCLQESVQGWAKRIQEKRIVEVDKSFHESAKELEGQGIHAMQERHRVVQGSHASLQSLNKKDFISLFNYIFHVFILTQEN